MVHLLREFFEENYHRLTPEQFSGCIHISEEFFEKHLDKVVWRRLSENPSISQEFFERHSDKVRWENLLRNPRIPVEFAIRFISEKPSLTMWSTCESRVPNGWNFHCPKHLSDFYTRRVKIIRENGTYTRTFRETSFYPLPSQTLSEDIQGRTECFSTEESDSLARNPAISFEFFEKNQHLLPGSSWNLRFWDEMSGKPLTPEQLERNHKIFNCDILCMNPSVPEEFFEKHPGKIDWRHICINPSISLEFFCRHLDKVDWKALSENPFTKQRELERKLEMAISTLKRRFLFTYYNPKHPRGIKRLDREYRKLTE